MPEPVNARLAWLAERPWLMVRSTLEALKAVALSGAQPLARLIVGDDDAPDADLEYLNFKGVAILPIQGFMMKGEVPDWFADYGFVATSTDATLAALEHALADPDVTSILFDIDSPGGEVAGVQELADAVFAARSQKPIAARVEDLCCSAAYWVAAQTGHISANATASVGSIGCYAVAYDTSGLFEKFGVVAHLISSGSVKGGGADGVPITEAHLAEWQKTIDGIAAMFTDAVAAGRGMDKAQVSLLATGATWLAGAAKALGLIDAIENSDAAFERARARQESGTPTRFGQSAQPTEGEARMGLFSRKKTRAASDEPDPVAPPAPEEEEETPAETPVEDAEARDVAAVAPEEDEPQADAAIETLKARVKAFGAVFAAKSIEEGMSDVDAAMGYVEALKAEAAAKDQAHAEALDEKATRIQHLEAALEKSGVLGEAEPVDQGHADDASGAPAREAELTKKGYDERIAAGAARLKFAEPGRN